MEDSGSGTRTFVGLSTKSRKQQPAAGTDISGPVNAQSAEESAPWLLPPWWTGGLASQIGALRMRAFVLALTRTASLKMLVSQLFGVVFLPNKLRRTVHVPVSDIQRGASD